MSDYQVMLVALATLVTFVLATASAIGFALRVRLSADGSNPVIENLNIRIQAWWIMVAVIAIAIALGRPAIILLFAFCSFAALRELVTILDTRPSDHALVAAAFYVFLPMQYMIIWAGSAALHAVFLPICLLLALPIIALTRRGGERVVARTAVIQWAVLIAVYCISFLPALLNLEIPGFEARNVLLIVFLTITAQISDVLQYVWGKLLGKTPIAPQLSPSKTVEGFLGGVLSAALIGAALWWITPFTPVEAGILALIIGLSGFVGGLVLSAVKREHGVKDWGQSIPGHGGYLDRLDSIVFSAPIFFHIVRLGWT